MVVEVRTYVPGDGGELQHVARLQRAVGRGVDGDHHADRLAARARQARAQQPRQLRLPDAHSKFTVVSTFKHIAHAGNAILTQGFKCVCTKKKVKLHCNCLFFRL